VYTAICGVSARHFTPFLAVQQAPGPQYLVSNFTPSQVLAVVYYYPTHRVSVAWIELAVAVKSATLRLVLRLNTYPPWGQARDQLSFPTYFYALANIAVGSEISWGFPVRGHLLDLCSCHEVQEVVKVCSALLLWSHIRNASPSP
jgi:hypothetical protein